MSCRDILSLDSCCKFISHFIVNCVQRVQLMYLSCPHYFFPSFFFRAKHSKFEVFERLKYFCISSDSALWFHRCFIVSSFLFIIWTIWCESDKSQYVQTLYGSYFRINSVDVDPLFVSFVLFCFVHFISFRRLFKIELWFSIGNLSCWRWYKIRVVEKFWRSNWKAPNEIFDYFFYVVCGHLAPID